MDLTDTAILAWMGSLTWRPLPVVLFIERFSPSWLGRSRKIAGRNKNLHTKVRIVLVELRLPADNWPFLLLGRR